MRAHDGQPQTRDVLFGGLIAHIPAKHTTLLRKQEFSFMALHSPCAELPPPCTALHPPPLALRCTPHALRCTPHALRCTPHAPRLPAPCATSPMRRTAPPSKQA
eukprot:364861-Chlamydomonas_euryale.AAC.21